MKRALALYFLAAIAFATAVRADDAVSMLPSQILDLANFKLTLPIGKEEKPDEIKQPTLAEYKNAEFFRASDDGKSVLFTAPVSGVTTSGSNYPRSELREMEAGGKTNAAWSTTQGKHRMFVREAITHLPDKKPHVVAAQIHDDKGYVILIRLEKDHLFVDRKNDKNGGTMTKSYKLGDIFSVEIIAEAGHIKTFYNGGKDPIDDFAIEATGCYFKAGCYTQSNLTKGEEKNAYAQVAIYEIKIEH